MTKNAKMEINLKTCIIILNYNNVEDTIKCIDSIERINTAAIKYIVVDNNTPQKQKIEILSEYLEQKFGVNYRLVHEGEEYDPILPYITLLLSSTNDGYAKGNNKGLLLAENDPEVHNILILNNDILFVEDIIPALEKYYYSIPDIGILSPMLCKNDLSLDLRCARKNTNIYIETIKKLLNYTLVVTKIDLNQNQYLVKKENEVKELMEIQLPSGSCMFINKKLFADIGFFDPNTFLYVEENILYKKLHRLGKKNFLCGKLKCIHLGGASTQHLKSKIFLLKCERDSFAYYWKEYEKHSWLLILIYRYALFQHRMLYTFINKYIKKTFS